MATVTSFEQFFKQHKKQKENGFYAPTASLVGKDGKPLQWEFRHLTSKENDQIRDDCTRDIPVTGKPGVYRQKLNNNEYLIQLVVASTVTPDLHNADLQDSYGVKSADDLVYAMIDDPGELSALEAWISGFNGFTKSLQEEVDEAKN